MVEGSQIIRLVESLNLLMIDETREKYLLTHVYYFYGFLLSSTPFRSRTE